MWHMPANDDKGDNPMRRMFTTTLFLLRPSIALRMGFAIAVLVMLIPAQAQVNLIKNGSFESPILSSGGFRLFSTGVTFSSWKVVGKSGNVAIVSGAFGQNGFKFPAESGKQWLDLTGTSNTPTGVAQTVPTKAGGRYLLTFFVGNVYNPGGIFGTTSTVNVFVNGVHVFKATNVLGKGQSKMVWEKFATTITASSTATRISFINGDPSSDTANGLDNITLVTW
jgi:Protein of unknown function (DUF642)